MVVSLHGYDDFLLPKSASIPYVHIGGPISCVSSCGACGGYITEKNFRYFVFSVKMGLPNSVITVNEYIDTSGFEWATAFPKANYYTTHMLYVVVITSL